MSSRPLPRGANVLSACQARAARAMMMLSVRELANRSEISDSTIRRIETGYGTPAGVSVDSLYKLQAWFEAQGFRFTWDPEPGPGLSWRDYPSNDEAADS